MRHFIILVPVSILLSCGQSSTKQKELELKEKELTLKEKELALKEKEDSIKKNEASNNFDNNEINKVTTTNGNPVPPTVPSGDEVATIENLDTKEGKFPIVKYSDASKSSSINSYIRKQVFGKNYNSSQIIKRMEDENYEGEYANYVSVEYKVKSNTNTQLVISIRLCFEGAAVHCAETTITFNPVTGSKSVKTIGP